MNNFRITFCVFKSFAWHQVRVQRQVHCFFHPRSFTAHDPKKRGRNIGVVLYQSHYYIGQASEERVHEKMGRDPYPNGSICIPWEPDPATAHNWHASLQSTNSLQTSLYKAMFKYMRFRALGSSLARWSLAKYIAMWDDSWAAWDGIVGWLADLGQTSVATRLFINQL